MKRNIVKSSNVLGVTVKNMENDDLGTIEEIVLDKFTGEVRYLVLSFGGFLGMGDKFFAIPWNAIHYDENQDAFTMNMSEEKLKNAPGFDKDNWPNMADTGWAEGVFNFYGTEPYWRRRKAA